MHHNLEWNDEKMTLLLKVSEFTPESTIAQHAENNGFVIKREFHATIISFQNGKKIRGAIESGNCTYQEIVNLAESFSWTYEYIRKWYVLQRKIPLFLLRGQVQTPAHTRRSVIQVINLPNLIPFFEELSSLTGIEFEIPFPHVTLYTWTDYEPESGSGIALNSTEDFERYLIDTISH